MTQNKQVQAVQAQAAQAGQPSSNQVAAAKESALFELFGRAQFENAALRGQLGQLQAYVGQLQKQIADAKAAEAADAKTAEAKVAETKKAGEKEAACPKV